MVVIFQKILRGTRIPAEAINTVFLLPDNWDDFGYKTLFSLSIFDEAGRASSIGNVKIGFAGQEGGWTEEQIPQHFNELPDNFYSLGQDADYYKNIVGVLSEEMANDVLVSLRDITYDAARLAIAENERAFSTSLLRSVNRSTIDQQFRRILRGDAALTDYNFYYGKASNERYSGIEVEFEVDPDEKPPSNIHILIGRNGVGKTTLLNNMVDALLPGRGAAEETGYFATRSMRSGANRLDDDYFAGIVSVSFSAFDPFTPPSDQPNANAGMRYHYVGLKKRMNQPSENEWILKNKGDLCNDFTNSLKVCFSLVAKNKRWLNAVRKLESDLNFAEIDLGQFTGIYEGDSSNNKQYFSDFAGALFNRMSSGHAVVLLTITKLVETVEEKTLVLLDEPESHLHPPLLSALTRALSDLLVNRNGVAIIATHSPVVLQEVPKSCVSILRRTRLILNVDRPETETFAENVGVLTREVFGLEVSKSGFHDLLANSVGEGKSYEEIVEEYQSQLGFEGKAILRSMVMTRESEDGSE